MWNTAGLFKVAVAVGVGLIAALVYRRWFSHNFWQTVGICAMSAACVIFLLDTFWRFIPLPGYVDEHIHDKAFSVMRSLALGCLVFLIAANYKFAQFVADLFLSKLPNKQ